MTVRSADSTNSAFVAKLCNVRVATAVQVKAGLLGRPGPLAQSTPSHARQPQRNRPEVLDTRTLKASLTL
ncbi:Uncharacterised protein [Mycobacterium tuberculosis]|uniref:Uncharacterized protein n=1 Tax=Mycobacterium tuberculosis TaxID=1773 RepID=A0A0U0S1J4_MYCTX|nr:Uncharacterised protein [Mycobacterium tuberculosis]